MRNLLRIAWIIAVAAFLGLLLHQRSIAQQELRPPMPPHLFTTYKLTPRLSIIAPSGPDMSNVGGNIVVFVADEGVLVVDDNYYRQRRNGQTVDMAEAVLAEIKKLTDRPVRFVINTHHHGDHAGGNPVFSRIATIYAQNNVRNRLLNGYNSARKNAPAAVTKAEQALAAAKAAGDKRTIAEAEEELAGARLSLDMSQSFDPLKAAPTVTYDGELVFHIGSEEIHLYHPARAHTDGDTLVHFKNANIALWGDAFANNWVPVIDAGAGGSSLEWLNFIDRGIQLVGENATMVPGHGAIAKADDVRRLRTYFTNLQDAVRKAIAAGKTREQAMEEVTVPGYARFPGGAVRIRQNVAAVYDEIAGRR